MKTKPSNPLKPVDGDDLLDYAYHLYVQSGCISDRDLDNWLEAEACIGANSPKSKNAVRSKTFRP